PRFLHVNFLAHKIRRQAMRRLEDITGARKPSTSMTRTAAVSLSRNVGHVGIGWRSSAIENVMAAVRFLRDPANEAKYRVDPEWLVVIGHSFGAFLAGYEGVHDPDIRAIAIISAVNL